jgi:hypothetical protein
MIGITKEELEALIYTDGYGNDLIDPDQAIAACKELDPWMPIADAPKDGRELYLKEGHDVNVGFWDDETKTWYVYFMEPTHYKEIKL